MGNKSSGLLAVGTVLSLLLFSLLALVPTLAVGGTGAIMTIYTNNTVSAATVSPTVNTSYSPAFQNGTIVTLVTYSNSTCLPSLSVLYPGSSQAANASKVTNCEVGTPVNETVALPRWNLLPAFAGPSIYGLVSWGATPSGYPTFNGNVIVTQCGASNTPSSCSVTKASYFYSPKQAALEQSLGIYNGINGWPEGVLPNPANDKVLPLNKTSMETPSYLVRIAVYDPNIFPNATTGKCTQVAASSLSNPTGNCLTSLSAIRAALVTTDNAIAVINSNNLLWQNSGKPTTQITWLSSLNLTATARLNSSNTNLISESYVSNTPSYPKVNNATAPANTVTTNTVVTTTAATTSIMPATTVAPTTTVAAISGSQPQGMSKTTTYVIVGLIVLVIIVVAAYALTRKKGKK
jgi:hypothetical protein